MIGKFSMQNEEVPGVPRQNSSSQRLSALKDRFVVRPVQTLFGDRDKVNSGIAQTAHELGRLTVLVNQKPKDQKPPLLVASEGVARHARLQRAPDWPPCIASTRLPPPLEDSSSPLFRREISR